MGKSGPRAGAEGVVEELKGRAKEAMGALKDDEQLKQEGQAQRDKAEAERAISRRINPQKALGGQENAKEISFEATVPAKKEFMVYIATAKGAGRTTDVKLSVKGR